jgi:hypothetical protein
MQPLAGPILAPARRKFLAALLAIEALVVDAQPLGGAVLKAAMGIASELDGDVVTVGHVRIADPAALAITGSRRIA